MTDANGMTPSEVLEEAFQAEKEELIKDVMKNINDMLKNAAAAGSDVPFNPRDITLQVLGYKLYNIAGFSFNQGCQSRRQEIADIYTLIQTKLEWAQSLPKLKDQYNQGYKSGLIDGLMNLHSEVGRYIECI